MKGSLLLSIFLWRDALSWDGHGHKIVSRIASRLMSKKSDRYVRRTLMEDPGARSHRANKLMSTVSSWADAVADELEWSRELHYANIPSDPRDAACGNFDLMRDCASQRCIVTAISNYTMRAMDIDRPVSERAEALKFLIHFVADIHQPLHLGFEDDSGGARIGLHYPEEHTLHQVWDSHLVENMINRFASPDSTTWYGAAEALSESFLDDESVIDVHSDPALGRFPSEDQVLSWASTIARETVRSHTCRSAYKNEFGVWIERGFSLSDEYVATRSRVVREQLMKAGVRLAGLLDSIADSFFAAERAADSAAMLESIRGANAVPAAVNQFSELDFDFDLDVDDLVYEIEVEEDEEENDSDDELEANLTTSAMPTGPVATTSTMSPEDKKRELARKKRMRAKVNKRKLFGVDVESVVLIKRGRAYYLTDVKLVTSESFVPAMFSVVLVKFVNSDEPMPFLFDSNVFPAVPPIELVRAVFKKLKGLDYNAELATAAGPAVEPTIMPDDNEVAGMTVVGYSGKTHEGESMISERFDKLLPLLERLGIKLDISTASVASIEDVLRPKLTKAQLKLAYAGTLPTDEQRAVDILSGQWGDLVSVTLGQISVVSRKDLLLDRSNRRWVFNKHSVINSDESLTKTSWLYIDVRVLDEPYSRPLAEALEKLSTSRPNRDVLREVVRRGSPILDRLVVMSRAMDMDVEASLQMVSVFEAQRFIDRNRPGYTSVEYVLREPADERYVRIALGAAEITKLTLDTLKLSSGAQWQIRHRYNRK